MLTEQKRQWCLDQITALSSRLNQTKEYLEMAEDSGNEKMIKSYRNRVDNLKSEIAELNRQLEE